jgi:hypothetical protein
VTLFTIGNILSLLGSFFLNGPYAQGKKMVGPEMRCATVAFLAAMGLTFFVAFWDGIKDDGERLALILVLIVVQYVCHLWFIICSVYFLKVMVVNSMKGCCNSYCPACAKGFACMCEGIEKGKDATKKAATSAAVATGVKKKEEKKSFFSMGNAT